ncbi:MAG TPA: hypothetical protein PLA54_14135 [Spirochaetota bacterium]|nr:hypothetical protein [Spirochaetota bacterium]HQE60325.1 hypothetical protein [Spirochaetota bacterium]
MKISSLRLINKISSWCFYLTFAAMALGFIMRPWSIDLTNSSGNSEISSVLVSRLWPFIAGFALMLLGFLLMIVSLIAGGISNISILRKGLEARAEIISVKESGTRVNDSPVLIFKLVVYPDNMPPFSAEAQNIVSITEIPYYRTGAFLKVRFMPENKETAVIGPE